MVALDHLGSIGAALSVRAVQIREQDGTPLRSLLQVRVFLLIVVMVVQPLVSHTVYGFAKC